MQMHARTHGQGISEIPLTLFCPVFLTWNMEVPLCSLAPHFLPPTTSHYSLQGSHTHFPRLVHSGGFLHWSQRGWGGQAVAGGVVWSAQDPALGQDSQHSHHPRIPDSTSTPCPSRFCRPRGSEDGGSCGTWERWREGSLLLPALSVTVAPVLRDGQLLWARPVPQAESPSPFSMWSCSADSCQLACWPRATSLFFLRCPVLEPRTPLLERGQPGEGTEGLAACSSSVCPPASPQNGTD